MADAGFPRRGRQPVFSKVLTDNCMLMKELFLKPPPPRSANDNDCQTLAPPVGAFYAEFGDNENNSATLSLCTFSREIIETINWTRIISRECLFEGGAAIKTLTLPFKERSYVTKFSPIFYFKISVTLFSLALSHWNGLNNRQNGFITHYWQNNGPILKI